MILGLSTAHFTQLHVLISLIGIASGAIVALGMLAGKLLPKMTALFLLTTVLTSVTGFLFPIHGITPGIKVGILSMIVLLFAVLARYSGHLAGGWRRTWVLTAMIALYFNVFVLIVQSFMKIPALHALAPAAFKIAQLITLIVFVVLTFAADRKFRPLVV